MWPVLHDFCLARTLAREEKKVRGMTAGEGGGRSRANNSVVLGGPFIPMFCRHLTWCYNAPGVSYKLSHSCKWAITDLSFSLQWQSLAVRSTLFRKLGSSQVRDLVMQKPPSSPRCLPVCHHARSLQATAFSSQTSSSSMRPAFLV